MDCKEFIICYKEAFGSNSSSIRAGERTDVHHTYEPIQGNA